MHSSVFQTIYYVHVYDNSIKIFFNYRNGEKAIDFASLEDNTKNRTPTNVSVRLQFSLARLIAVCLPIPEEAHVISIVLPEKTNRIL